jgi:inhibitor of KinA sporulation pathway (predicted exonuclease)
LFAQKILKTEDLKNAPKNPKDALIELGYEFSGFNHRGIDDAKNISFLLKLLL